MDYEKKYNEALKWMRELYPRFPGAFKEEIEHYFPELRESDDERMMREFNDWLCEEIECRTNDLRDEKDRRTLIMLCYILTKVKDWLEKQKEQKPANHNLTTWHRDVVYSAMCDKNLDEGLRCNLEVVYKTIKELVDRTPVVEEQKPSEWNPNNEDVVLFNKAVTTNPNLTPSERAKLDIIRMKFKHCNGHIATNDFDLALGERYIQGYNDGHNDAFGESKPAEWSEEDEKKIGRLRSVVNQLASYTDSLDVNGDYCEGDYAELDTWLKSLRPSWKPSEEHLSALLAVFNDPNNIGSQTCQLALTDLYEHLKKL